MKPIKFKQSNTIYAKNQPQYNPLPSHKSEEGVVTSCWTMTWGERLRTFCTGKVYVQTMTFNDALQPQLVSVENPLEK